MIDDVLTFAVVAVWTFFVGGLIIAATRLLLTRRRDR